MPTAHRSVLASIKRFDQLIAYLRDEMNWPIARDSFDDVDDLFFEFTPDELGLDKKNAAKIQEIKRLRPLSVTQPWGIFFIKFEPKRLPVVALRRILSRVTHKKRASANSDDRTAWAPDDLLFVSNYGEGENRQISFAHFAHNKKKDLPTLQVLGWDNLNTPLHLDHVAETLTEKLTWPNDESDEEAWKSKWRSAFTLEHRQVVNTSKTLSEELAKLARNICKRIKTILSIETKSGPLSSLMEVFVKTLLHDLDSDGFADMYAQTIAYGLLSARVANPSGSTADEMVTAMPVTNPFLKELMETFLDIGGRKGKAGSIPALDFDELGISEVVELLDLTNMEAVLRDFGDKNPLEDPVIHFYELFLKEYDPRKRMQRGVFYTPRPIVSFIVCSVDKILRTRFGLEDGLADTTTWKEMINRFKDLKIPDGTDPNQAFVQILDPATGTGTFLVEAIDLIYQKLSNKWRADGNDTNKINDLWNEYVPKHLLTRLHGYELMMAPYAIAHMKIGLKLYETGYRFESNERARIYLTNAVEPAMNFSGKFQFDIPALANEAQAVNGIKNENKFTVVMGNPPYSVVSQNSNNWINSKMELYKKDVRSERNIQPLSDDYIKFIRFGHFLIECSKTGILCMITNHTYLSGVIHRGMRKQIISFFDIIEVLDLHGSALLGLTTINGISDQNVFDIQQGVSILKCIKRFKSGSSKHILRCDLLGLREQKYETLLGKLPSPRCFDINPTEPFYFFTDSKPVERIYEESPSISDIIKLSSVGFVSGKDESLISINREPIVKLVQDLANTNLDKEYIYLNYGIKDTSGWPVGRRRRDVANDEHREKKVKKISYRPFDDRYSFYSNFLQRSRYSTFRHLKNNNLALIVSRLVKGEEPGHVFVSRLPVEKIFLSPKTSNNAFAFPIYSYDRSFTDNNATILSPTFDSKFIRILTEKYGIKWKNANIPSSNEKLHIYPEKLLGYIYSILYSNNYRLRYADQLKIDFPRILIPKCLDLFSKLAQIGEELVSIHLLESPKVSKFITNYIGPDRLTIHKIGWLDDTVWLDTSKTNARIGHRAIRPGSIGFEGVTEKVWDFCIGGYQICHKWLKDRQEKKGKKPCKGHILTKHEINHYQKIIVAIDETIRIVEEIDKAIDEHGGFPNAFI